MMIEIRKGQASEKLSRQAFGERYRGSFVDPAFATEEAAIARLEVIAWLAYDEGRKAPLTRPAGAGYFDPTDALSVQWLATRQAIDQAQLAWGNPATKSRVLLVCGSARNDGTCPGEVSKTWRLTEIAQQVVQQAGVEADVLDLSLVTSEYGRNIHPCKGCVSSAMPLCHWPCSCYPNHSLAQTHDWMAQIYERWVAAHAVILLAPTYWYQTPSPLKLMIDRLVCADGGNPDPTTTHGKRVLEAKRLEEQGWDYPKHLAGRVFGVVVHGEVAGVEDHRRNLCDWLEWMGLIDAGAVAKLDRYIGYYEPYYNSHEALDKDSAVQEEVRNVTQAVLNAVHALRAGRLSQPDKQIKSLRQK
ncbi:multimeric flavodoxin WrbA [Rhodoferax antarcticus]|nr:flavodoxin family protein [Rhodoferax antarcticus]MCW2312277.1 multimeric flavodoxin WrbA [Rhodoferax antarcticus]